MITQQQLFSRFHQDTISAFHLQQKCLRALYARTNSVMSAVFGSKSYSNTGYSVTVTPVWYSRFQRRKRSKRSTFVIVEGNCQSAIVTGWMLDCTKFIRVDRRSDYLPQSCSTTTSSRLQLCWCFRAFQAFRIPSAQARLPAFYNSSFFGVGSCSIPYESRIRAHCRPRHSFAIGGEFEGGNRDYFQRYASANVCVWYGSILTYQLRI